MMLVLKDLLSSKKFIVMIATIAMTVASKLGLNLDPELVTQIVAMAAAYIIGQGIADNGKEAAKMTARTAVNDNAATTVAAAPTTETPATPAA